MTEKKYLPVSYHIEVAEHFPFRVNFTPSKGIEAEKWLKEEFGPSAWTRGGDMPLKLFKSFQKKGSRPLVFVDLDYQWFCRSYRARFKKAEDAVLFKLRWA